MYCSACAANEIIFVSTALMSYSWELHKLHYPQHCNHYIASASTALGYKMWWRAIASDLSTLKSTSNFHNDSKVLVICRPGTLIATNILLESSYIDSASHSFESFPEHELILCNCLPWTLSLFSPHYIPGTHFLLSQPGLQFAKFERLHTLT